MYEYIKYHHMSIEFEAQNLRPLPSDFVLDTHTSVWSVSKRAPGSANTVPDVSFITVIYGGNVFWLQDIILS